MLMLKNVVFYDVFHFSNESYQESIRFKGELPWFGPRNIQNGAEQNTGAFDLKTHVQTTSNLKLHSFSAK